MMSRCRRRPRATRSRSEQPRRPCAQYTAMPLRARQGGGMARTGRGAHAKPPIPVATAAATGRTLRRNIVRFSLSVQAMAGRRTGPSRFLEVDAYSLLVDPELSPPPIPPAPLPVLIAEH